MQFRCRSDFAVCGGPRCGELVVETCHGAVPVVDQALRFFATPASGAFFN
jgi:hypothetical protein